MSKNRGEMQKYEIIYIISVYTIIAIYYNLSII